MDNIREKAIEYREQTGMTIADFAETLGISRTTLSKYINGTYESNPDKIESVLDAFFAKEDDKKGGIFKKKSAKPPIFFESEDAVNITAACSMAQKWSGLGIIVGKSGYGKTYALKNYAQNMKVCYIECDDSMTSRDLIEAMEMKLNIPKGTGTIWNRVQHIKEYFDINDGYIMIIDEADKLMTKYSAKKMEILRAITDQCDIGLIVAGEPALESMLRTYLPRFANRADYYVKLRGLKGNEVEEYLGNMNITPGAIEELKNRGTNKQTGCFRLLNRTLKNLFRMKDQMKDDESEITEQDIKMASKMMML